MKLVDQHEMTIIEVDDVLAGYSASCFMLTELDLALHIPGIHDTIYLV